MKQRGHNDMGNSVKVIGAFIVERTQSVEWQSSLAWNKLLQRILAPLRLRLLSVRLIRVWWRRWERRSIHCMGVAGGLMESRERVGRCDARGKEAKSGWGGRCVVGVGRHDDIWPADDDELSENNRMIVDDRHGKMRVKIRETWMR